MLNSSECREGSVSTEDIWIISEKWKWNFKHQPVFQKFASVCSCQWKWKDVYALLSRRLVQKSTLKMGPVDTSDDMNMLCKTNFIALCGYPIVKMEIRDSSQISTTAPIFLLYNYFRQKYLKIASCAVSLLNNIWVRVEHSLLQQANLKRKSTASQAVYRHDVNKIVGTSWTLDSESTPNICRCWKKTTNIYIFQIPFSPCWGPRIKKLFWGFFLSTC